jgi:glycosyltransferase involved in cell wall biosynthesis
MPITELNTGTDQAVSLSPLAVAPVRVAAFTGSRTVSSPRFRVRQYVPYLETLGVQITEFIARLGSWPPRNKGLRPLWFPATLLDRVPSVLKSYQYDVTLLQREMVSTLATLERFTRRPRIFDVDDAVWLNRNSEKNFASLVRMCDGVICGNSFLEEKVRQWQSETIVLPTAVDSDRFCPLSDSINHGPKKIIGWSGIGYNLKYLLDIESALALVLHGRSDVVLRVVSDQKPQFRVLESSKVEYIPWSPENEVRTIQEMFLGLMPAEDSLWARGKCSYKMLLYMACGVPVVVSPVGMNSEVLSLGNVGFGAAKSAEWTESIIWLLDNPDNGQQMGRVGRRVIEERFSLHALAPRLADYLRKFHN